MMIAIPQSMRSSLSVVVASGALILIVMGCGTSDADESALAPDFELTLYNRLNEPDGAMLHLSDYRGKAVVLNFWATWCAPCRVEMPSFEQTYREYKDQGAAFIGVDMGVSFDPSDKDVVDFLNEVDVTYPVGFAESSSVGPDYGIVGLPATVFIDRHGQVTRKWTGEISRTI